jgi:tRNA A-37 threonylcarbamoyl transferase component Bud32
MYVVCTRYIERASTLQRRHKKNALQVIVTMHRLGILHNDIRADNFIVGKDYFSPTGERIYVIDFHLSLINNELDPIPKYMFDDELQRVEQMFENLS